MLKILKNLKDIKKDFILSLFLVVIAQIVTLILPLTLRNMTAYLNDGTIPVKEMSEIYRLGGIMAAGSILNVLTAVISSYFTAKTSMGFGRIVREKIFLKVETLSQCDIDVIGTPSLITRSTADIKVLQDFLLQSLRVILAAPIALVGGIVMAFIMNARLATIIFAAVPVIALITFVIYKTVVPLFKKRQLMTDEVTRFLRQKLSGIRVMKAFNTVEYEDDIFTEKNKKLSGFILKFSRIMSALLPVCITLVILLLDIMIYAATKSIDALDSVTQADKIQNSVSDLTSFVIYMAMIIGAISMAAAMFVIVPRANISAKRINEIMEIQPKITDPENPEAVDENKIGEVRFENVSFSYATDEPQNILENVSFTAEKGKTTAIIGATGSGKTTILTLISRFYDVNDGAVYFDGVDVRNLTQEELHSRISYVPQRGMLFSGSIKDNLLYGDENASDEKLQKAIEISQAEEFISTLPDGINSFVTQNATNYSGGQKQRLSIARALVRDADVYLFDDSFSALDFKTDSKLRAALKENVDATLIIVAQRVGTIMEADKIIVLDEGRVVGQGTHKELYETCPIYKEIALSQLSAEEVASHE